MAADVPRTINMRITKDDVFSGIFAIVEDMSKLRRECVMTATVDERHSYDYLQLTSFLAQSLLAVADDTTKERLSFLVQEMNKSELLVNYDPLQRRYWARHNQKFVSTLETVLIQLYGEKFKGIDASHHLVSALKYVCAKNEIDPREREKIIGTIRPVAGMVRGADLETLCAYEALTGQQTGDGLNFTVGRPYGLLKKMLQVAQEIGALSFTAEMDAADYDKLRKEFASLLPEKVNFRQDTDGRNTVHVSVLLQPTATGEPVVDCISKADQLLRQPELIAAIQGYAPYRFDQFLFDLDPAGMETNIRNQFEHRYPCIDAHAIDVSSVFPLATRLMECAREISRYPETYGYAMGEHVVVNELVARDDNEEHIWVGSRGTICGFSDTLSIEFQDPEAKGKKKKSIIWDIDPRYLTVVSEPTTQFPAWYRKRPIEIGSIVKIGNGYDYDESDLPEHSVGKVIGLAYTVDFETLVDKSGAATKGWREDEINQAYLSRVRLPTAEDLAETQKQIINEAIELTPAGHQFHIRYLAGDDFHGYAYGDSIDGYARDHLVFFSGQDAYLMYILTHDADTEKGAIRFAEETGIALEKMDETAIMAQISSGKGRVRVAFEEVAGANKPIYISLRRYRDGKVQEFYEGRL